MKKNGFIATSILYAFFLVFITLFIGLITAYAHNKAAVLRINEKVKEELQGLRKKTLADLEPGDNIKFDYDAGTEYLNPDGKWIVATKEDDGNGKVTIVLASDRETPKRDYQKDFKDYFEVDANGQRIKDSFGADKANPGYSVYHRGLEGMEVAIRQSGNKDVDSIASDIQSAIKKSSNTTVKIDILTLDTINNVIRSDIPEYVKDNIINVGSDYVLKNTRNVNFTEQMHNEATTSCLFTDQPNGQALITEAEYPHNISSTNPQAAELKKALHYGSTANMKLSAGYYHFRMYNFGANIDPTKLTNIRYAKALNALGVAQNSPNRNKMILQEFYRSYCGVDDYDNFIRLSTNPDYSDSLLSYVSQTFDSEHGINYVDWCYYINPFPYVHKLEDHVISYQGDYEHCTIGDGFSDYIAKIGEAYKVKFTEYNIRLQMTIELNSDERDPDDSSRFIYDDYILAGNGTIDNIYVYTTGSRDGGVR